MFSYLSGFGTGLSLIVAIGAQNAFVLRQGLVRRFVFPVVAICALSDLILIVLGVSGIGLVVQKFPAVLEIFRYAGALFLLCYGISALMRSFKNTGSLQAASDSGQTLKGAVAACLAFTFLNPHVYLDTMILIGSIASSFGEEKWCFAAGAGSASILWFTALGYGARLLTPVFKKPAAWKVLDFVIGITMLALAAMLAAGT